MTLYMYVFVEPLQVKLVFRSLLRWRRSVRSGLTYCIRHCARSTLGVRRSKTPTNLECTIGLVKKTHKLSSGLHVAQTVEASIMIATPAVLLTITPSFSFAFCHESNNRRQRADDFRLRPDIELMSVMPWTTEETVFQLVYRVCSQRMHWTPLQVLPSRSLD